LSISLELRDRAASDSSLLGNVITGDETWVCGYDPETRVQSFQWKSLSSPRANKAHQSRSNIKMMMIVFFDLDGIVRAEFVPRNTTVNSEYFKGLLERLRMCPHPPYSPDLAPCDFWLFLKVKMTMKGKHFESIQDIEAATTAQLKTLTKEDFQNCFRKWQERWDKCVRSGGEYFEGY